MGTLDGNSVEPEVLVEESVKGMVEVLKAHVGTGRSLYLDWQGCPLPW
jgi:hypothetical protein